MLKQAKQLGADAQDTNNKTTSIVNNANNSVLTVNLLLNLALAAAALGGTMVFLLLMLGTRSTLKTLGDARKDLIRARVELGDLRKSLNAESEDIRVQADKALRALTLMQLGEQQIARHNLQSALQMYQQAYDLDPTNSASNYFLGELYIQTGQFDKGIERLQQTLVLSGEYAPAEAAIGTALYLQAMKAAEPNKRDILYAHAEDRFLTALDIDPAVLDFTGESIYAALGELYKQQGRIERAIHRYDEARKITPQKPHPLVNLAILYLMQGQFDQAQDYFMRSVEMAGRLLTINADDYQARLDRLIAWLALGKRDDALSDVAIVLKQVKTTAPLENTLNDLILLRNTAIMPDDLDQVIQQTQAALRQLNAHEPITIKS